MDQRLTNRIPRSQRARATNDPLSLPRGWSLTTAKGRRYRDLALTYSEELGPERLASEAVRTRLRTLIWLTVQLEQLQGDDNSNAATTLHYCQEVRALSAELFGKSVSPNSHRVSDDRLPHGDFVRAADYIVYGHYDDEGKLVVTPEDPLRVPE